jgi:hypothetical protein
VSATASSSAATPNQHLGQHRAAHADPVLAAVIGTDIYVPGYTGTVYLSTLQVFHTATNTWETVATDRSQ